MTFRAILLSLLTLLSIGFAKAEDKEVKIGLIAPLSGDGAYWGENFLKGIQLAVNDLNKEREVKLKLYTEDDHCESQTSVTSFQKLTSVDHIQYFLGPVCSSSSAAVAPLVAKARVPTLACSESADIPNGDGFLFRLWVPNDRQGRVLAQYAIQKSRSVAMISIENIYGKTLSNAFKKEYENLGGKVAILEEYNPTQKDFRASLLRIRNSHPEMILMVSYTVEGAIVFRQIRESGLKMPVISVSTINSPDFFKAVGDIAEGLVFSDLEDVTSPQFRDRWSREYNVPWPGFQSCASVGYDGMRLLAKILNEVGDNKEKVRETLQNQQDFKGVTGAVTFESNGSLKGDHRLFLRKNGKNEIIQ